MLQVFLQNGFDIQQTPDGAHQLRSVGVSKNVTLSVDDVYELLALLQQSSYTLRSSSASHAAAAEFRSSSMQRAAGDRHDAMAVDQDPLATETQPAHQHPLATDTQPADLEAMPNADAADMSVSDAEDDRAGDVRLQRRSSNVLSIPRPSRCGASRWCEV